MDQDIIHIGQIRRLRHFIWQCLDDHSQVCHECEEYGGCSEADRLIMLNAKWQQRETEVLQQFRTKQTPHRFGGC